MFGSIIGDMVGSAYGRRDTPTQRTDFLAWTPRSHFTDDTVLTVATAEAILTDGDYRAAYLKWTNRYPQAGYGPAFKKWASVENPEPYDSFGNGSAMRVGPVGWAFETLEETLAEAEKSAACSHNHPEGIKGAQAIAAAIFWARNGESKDFIRRSIEERFGYDLSRTCDEIRPGYVYGVTCQKTVPEALTAFLDASDVEETVRLAVAFAGDADTLACMGGSVAEAFWGASSIPNDWRQNALERLDERLKTVVDAFEAKFSG